MSFKVLLLVAACVAVCAGQNPVSDKEINSHQSLSLGKNRFRRNLPNNIITDLLEAFGNLDVIREDINTYVRRAKKTGRDPQVIIDCFKAQKDLYYSVGEEINDLLRQASEEISAELGDKSEEFAQKISVPISKIGEIMKTLPQEMMELLEQQEFGKAMELMKASRRVFIENARMIYRTIGELRAEMPQVAQTAFRWADKIRSESAKGVYTVRESFKKCVQEGGPK